ncbi:hypothetical protein BCR39DRAFT_538185 [Naematelia encephala]|uniref:Ubiquinol-cytochrome c chaperone domain-containing protein n=1 Tax=Naematelia encephala TaxID=71784 RepID=A0A1Y2B045_9TREE|nr:hypothetical protein BCR39DRAFT_538185 [Naematelia encephala]
MSSLSRRTALSLSVINHAFTPLTPLRTLSACSRRLAAPTNNDPLPVPSVVFPVPKDPFQRTAGEQKRTQTVSETRVAIARGIARVMGYNSKSSTAIRETSRIMKGIVEAVEKDKDFWYDRCGLPPTYQSFFQLHLLYILIIIPRLRTLPASLPIPNSPIPESQEPSEPTNSSPTTSTSTTTTESSTVPTASSSVGYFSKPNYQIYPSELINHFFELAEAQMRKVLGRGERERVVKKYMQEMGEQWKGASVSLDYVLGLSISQDPALKELADPELAAWVWRNLFSSRGMPLAGALAPGPAEAGGYIGEAKEIELTQSLGSIVYWIRKEMNRLEAISDEDVLTARIGAWGSPGL